MVYIYANVLFILYVQANITLALEKPVLKKLSLSGVGVHHGVHVAYGGLVSGLQLLFRHDADHAAVEDHGAVGGAGVVKLAGQQEQSNSKWFI